MSMKELIESPKEWDEYISKLDRSYSHDHRGDEPEKFPCVVVSIWGDDPNGPYYYDHWCIYLDDFKKESWQ